MPSSSSVPVSNCAGVSARIAAASPALHVQLRQDSLGRAICARDRSAGVAGAALRYRFVEEAARRGHREQSSDAHAAG